MQKTIHIIGAGTVGVACAIQAAKKNVKVIVYEKTAEVGGTLHITAGHLSAANTNYQQSKNITDSVELHYQDIVRISRNTMDETIAKKAVELAPITLNWLETLGYPFHEKTPMIIHGHEPYSVARTYFGVNDVTPAIDKPGKTILNLLLPYFNELVKERKIELHLNTALEKFQKIEDVITSIHFKNLETKATLQQSITHKDKIVLCTGGYAANPSFFNKITSTQNHQSQRLISTAKETSTGDGIIAAMQIGAAFHGGEKHSSTLGGIELEPNSGRTNFWKAWARVSNGVDRKQREIYVNDCGHRFMNEFDLNADERERIVLQQPNQRFWILFDDVALKDGASLIPQFSVEDIIKESKNEKAIWQANTIQELCYKTKLPFDCIQQTIKQYNHAVKVKNDAAFNRTYLAHSITKPPYYAVLCYAYSLISFGGLKVNSQLQVVQQNYLPIENLFAAGEILGAAATSGHAFCGGMLLTPAISFGKWLGETL
jgi:fumarate reductase flavoprotein subunit